MLAEIFLLRLEMAMRIAEEASAAMAPRFVPLPRGAKPQFKKKLAAV
jgi:hypothetical protein